MTPDNLQLTLSPEHLSISSSLKALRKAVTFICFIFPIPDVFSDSCPSGRADVAPEPVDMGEH